ncbi:MAG: Ig-like domain-containing protein, partial [Bdellovibrionota bacterium]|nr:Ig-like domain-containing protein [Bdellovibrionota bacterium]
MKANNLSVAVCLFTFVISFAFANNPPSIDLGNNITALAGSRVQLNAIVADSDNDDVSVVWKVLYSPSGSRKEFSQFSGESTKFSLDRVGPYVIQAEVRDGTDSSIDTISIFSTETPGETVFGPVTNFASPYCRDLNHKKCVKNAFDFDITNPGDNYTLLVRNNGFVSASISLNGERLTSFYDFSGGEENLAINVSLLASNNIEVVAIGNPNASIDVLIKRNETVINNNNPPTLDVSTISYFGNSGGTADLIATAGDAGQTLFYQILKQPNNGILSVEVDTLVFKPRINTNENGQGIVAVFDDGNPQMVAVQTVDILFNDGNRAPTVRGSMEATAGEVRTFTPIIEDNSGDTHFITIDSQPLSGTVELNDLTLIYTPEPDFVGEISYLITVTDNQNPPLSTQYEVRGSVLPNFAPTLTGSFNQQVEQGNELRTNFQGSDSNSTQVTDIRIEVGPINGSASISNGKLTYQPNPGFSGNDTITLRVSDSAATPKFTNYDLEINVLENAAPSVPGSPFSRTLNVGQEFGQVVFFQDVNVNQAHILEIVKEPIGGTATLEGAFLSYAAGANFVGEDEIVVQITDDGVPAKSTLAVIQLDVRGNTVPNPGISWIRQNPNSIPSSTFVDFTILNGDPDPSQNHRIEIIQQPTNGQITPNLFWDTRFSYRSKDGYDGSDSFIVRVTDDGVPSFSVEKEFTINVINNRPPSPRDYEIAVLSGLQKRVSIWDNDPDNGQDHVYEIVQAPTQGTAVLDGIGLIYTANPDSSGQDQIIVRVRDNGFPVAEGFSNINVTIKENSAPSFRQINDPPRVVINTARSFFVRYTDRDERDGQTVAKAISQQPANGTVVINSEGNGFIGVTYTPNEDFLGFDSFQLSATDNGIPSLQDFITVVVNVIENTAPELNISSINALEGYSVPRGVVTVTDPDSTRFTYGIFASPAEGNANISDRGVVTYTPNVGFSGTDQIGIIVTEFDGGVDGLSTVGVMAINVVDNVPPEPMDEEIETFQSTPIRRNLSPNDPNSIDFRGTFRYRVLEFPANGNLEFSESFGSYTYTPAPGFSGQDSFRYEVIETPPFFEDTLTAQASVTINVTPNTSPSIDLENLTLIAGETVQDSFELLDPDNGQQLTVEVRNEPSFGNAEVVRVGLNNYRITYNSTSFQGNDSIELRVSDNAVPKGISDITIPINVEENFPPVITPLSLSVVQGESVNTQISFTDANAGQSYLYSITNQPSFGTATLSQTGLLSYSPNLGSAIDDSITVRITDTSALAIFSEITIPIDVIENAIPILASNPSSISTFQSQSATAQVSFTDDNSNQTHTYGIQTASQNGTVTISQQGLLTYNPTIGFSGNDSVTVYVEDNANPPGRGKLIIPITVTANTTPLLSSTPASVDTFQGTLATGTISFVDPDPGQSHTFAVVNSGAKGIAAIDQLGNFTYTPNQGETGADSIEFSVKDNANPPATGTITLAVNIIANTNPVIAGDNSLSTFQSTQIESIYTISDIDQGQNLNLEIANSTTNGSLSLSQITGTDQYRVTYFPDTGFSGTDSFILRGRDDANPNGEVFFPVSITIEANSLPIVSDASLAFVQSDNPKSLQISFTDPDANQTHTYGVQTSPSKGDVQISSEGLLTYTPFFDQSGSDSFEISVSDSATPSGVGTATITVNIDPNSAPVLDPIADVSIKTSSSQTIAVTANDINPNQDLNYRITQFPTEV